MKWSTKDLAYNGVIAAIYVALTLASIPISFGAIQFRIAEILVLLVFFNKKYTLGVCIGTAIANFGTTLMLWDVLFGTLATLLACICIMLSKHLLTTLIYPVIFNGLIVGFELYWFAGFDKWQTFVFSSLTVAAGELVVLIAGYVIFMLLKKRKDFAFIINGNQNLDFKW